MIGGNRNRRDTIDTPTAPTNGTTDEPREVPPLLTVPQTATLIGMSIRSTYRAIEADAIPHFRMGRRITIPTAKLLDQLGLPIHNITWTVD